MLTIFRSQLVRVSLAVALAVSMVCLLSAVAPFWLSAAAVSMLATAAAV